MNVPLNINTFTRTSLTLYWSIEWALDGYYVIEKIGEHGYETKWGPVPTKTIAVALVGERKAWAEGETKRIAAEFGGRKD